MTAAASTALAACNPVRFIFISVARDITSGPPKRPRKGLSEVADGTRTHDNRNHNPGLYQLSYSHHCCGTRRTNSYAIAPSIIQSGAPDRTRTCYPRLRRPVLYPLELRALGYQGLKGGPD